MNQPYPFIFSNERKYRIWRHVSFWGFWFLFQGFLYAFIPASRPVEYFQRIPSSMLGSLMFLPVHMFLSYTLMYFVIPGYVVKQKYISAALWIFLLIIATACMSAIIAIHLLPSLRVYILTKQFFFPLPESPVKVSFFLSLLAGLRGGITIGGLAAAIKLMKHWYAEGQRNIQLQKENIEAQLQILKAQVHPHFFFNTLNNIYSYTQNISPVASQLVMGLSDMLRYMLYECNQPLVPLSKELKMIREYINLEKIRYGNKLEIHVNFPSYLQHLFISPLLLLPFIENCFKHGISNVLEHPWLNLDISVEKNVMNMKLLNSKPDNDRPSHKPGIGIENAKKRLGLLYPNKHHLIIKNEEEVFIVNLKLELEKRQSVSKPVIQIHSALTT
jgi:sensor histidine kinase YesM